MEKEKVIQIIKSDLPEREQFNELLSLYVAHPHHIYGVARFLNASGFTPANLESLKYDIQKAYEITDAEVREFVSVKKATPVAKQEKKTDKQGDNPYKDAPSEVKDGIKLRVEFPFLNDDDCPDKMKILVADKFSAIKKYEDAHAEIQKLKDSGDNELLFQLAKKAVENWELNQLIYDELNYYQENKEILGNLPIFAEEVLQKKVDAYSVQELLKRQGNLRSYISREGKKLEKAKGEKKEAIEAKIKDWQDELNLIDARLNAPEKK